MSGTFLEIVAFDTAFKHEAEGLSQHTPPPSEAMSPFSFKADDEILELLPPRVDRANAIACDACYTSKRGVTPPPEKIPDNSVPGTNVIDLLKTILATNVLKERNNAHLNGN
jgi:hypothetical protein